MHEKLNWKHGKKCRRHDCEERNENEIGDTNGILFYRTRALSILLCISIRQRRQFFEKSARSPSKSGAKAKTNERWNRFNWRLKRVSLTKRISHIDGASRWRRICMCHLRNNFSLPNTFALSYCTFRDNGKIKIFHHTRAHTHTHAHIHMRAREVSIGFSQL